MALEQHAVPSQVTAYEFRLVGDMTLKQFGWLAGGLIVGIIMYSLPLPGYIRWPLVLLLTPSGALIAFVPFEGRGLDRWILAFFKAIYAPTEYLWRQEHPVPDFLTKSFARPVVSSPTKVTQRDEAQLEEYIHTLPVLHAANALDQQEAQQVEYFNQLISTDLGSISPSSSSSPPSMPIIPEPAPLPPEPPPIPQEESEPVPTPLDQTESSIDISDSSQSADGFSLPTTDLKEILQQPTPISSAVDLEELQKQVAQTLKVDQPATEPGTDQSKSASGSLSPNQDETSQMSARPVATSTPADQELQATITQPDVSSESGQSASSVSLVAEPANFSDQLPVTPPAQPNIVAGMVVDAHGKIVDNAIVEVKDQYNKPVRAFKTNKLGQFSIATALNNGVYIIEVEKTDLNFTPVKFEATGQVIKPIEIRAK